MTPLFLVGLIAALALGQRLPPPSGKYSVGHRHYNLTDLTRREPFKPSTWRSIMVHHFFPIPKIPLPPSTPYGAAPVLRALENAYSFPPDTLDTIKGNTHWRPLPPSTNKPTIIFSHGTGTSVVLSITLLEDLASHGRHVLAIDHPYDAAAVTFRDGETIYAANTTLDDIEDMLRTRVDDVGFVLRQLWIRRAVAIGHSLGGATAVDSARKWPTVLVGAVNMDGYMFNTTDAAGRKVFLFSAWGSNRAEWETFEERHTGWVRHAEVKGFTHASFTDLGWLAKTLGVKGADKFVGTVRGSRQVEIVRRFVRDFVEFLEPALLGKQGKLVNGEGKGFDEVVFEEDGDDHGY